MKLLKSLVLVGLVCVSAMNAKAGNVGSHSAPGAPRGRVIAITPQMLAEMVATIMYVEAIGEIMAQGHELSIGSVEELRSFIRTQRARPCQHPFHIKLLSSFPADAKIDEEGEFKSIEVGSTVFNLPSNVASITFVAEEEVEA